MLATHTNGTTIGASDDGAQDLHIHLSEGDEERGERTPTKQLMLLLLCGVRQGIDDLVIDTLLVS